MKKSLVFMILAAGIITAIIGGILLVRQFEANEAKKPNTEFEYILNKEMYGTDVVSIINKAVNSNEKNKIEKDENGFYINDEKYCIEVEIAFRDVEKTYKMEQIINAGIEEFMRYI